MAQIVVHETDIELDRPTLIEGLPGVGLVGKIATDHVVDSLEMTHYASVQCEGLPQLAVYHEGDSGVRAPVRVYADEDRDLLALQSEVPVSPRGATEFAECVTGWLADNEVTPIFLSGRPSEDRVDVPELFGIATGDGARLLSEAEIEDPTETGAVSGPTGALLAKAAEIDLSGVGLVVESDPQFPDPAAARVLIDRGIEPIAGVEVDTDALVDRAEEIREQRERLAQRMQEVGDDQSTQAQPLRMYQ